MLFTHTLYRDDMLERVISATSTVFFCALELTPENIAGSSGSARNVDPGSLQESDLDIGVEYEDDESKSTEERTLLRAKRGLRKALKERRLLAVSSIDGIIDFWKQILTVSGNTPCTSERTLQSFVDEDHDFDPYAVKRRTITILMRYLPSMWAHEAVSSLPPSTVRNLLDLMQVALKAIQDSKFFPLQSTVSERDRQRSTTDMHVVVPASSSAPTNVTLTLVNTAAPVPSRPNARLLRRGATGDGASSSFRVYESAVTILTDMGFLEADVRRLATAHRTNSITTLTTHLLEMGSTPTGTGVEATRDATAAFLVSASAAVASMPAPSEEVVYQATVAADGVQHVRIEGGGDFFKPNRVIVRVNVPLELTVSVEKGFIPHTFVMHSPEAGLLVDEKLSSDAKVIRLTPTAVGKYHFYCKNKLLFFKSHRDKGMEGMLEVVE